MAFELRDYPHLKFHRCWILTPDIAINLGKCVAMIECIGNLPVEPDVQENLRRVSFERGAQATTAIEGNTLSDDELRRMVEGRELPESRKYQAKEVKNALDAMSAIWADVVPGGSRQPVSGQMLCRFNKMIGEDLGDLYDGIPGRFRNDRRTVARYLAPNPEHVEPLVNEFCDWLRREFRYDSGNQPMEEAIVQAIVSHIFFEWIHPFADGNGRTGRMLEFYILLRAGLPDITAHVLANHYNGTRQEYTAQFDNARKKRSLTDFLRYAIQGFADGLKVTLEIAQNRLVSTVWREVIYKAFKNYTSYNKRTIFIRRRDLALAMPLDRPFTAMELVRTSDSLAEQYMSRDKRMLASDINELINLKLVLKNNDGTFEANWKQLLSGHVVPRACGRQSQ